VRRRAIARVHRRANASRRRDSKLEIVAGAQTMTKECPMCSEIMRVHSSEREEKIPGTTQIVRRQSREWRCPECDYFEDVEPDEVEVE
jgi:C4-type Zn-finger protein